MSNTTVKLQIPLDKTLRDRVAKHAKKQGFSSIQDYTRVVYSTIVSNDLQMSLSEPHEERISPEAEARYARQLKQFEKDKKAGRVKSFDNVDEALKYLHSA